MNRLAVIGLLFVMTLTLFPFHVRAAESQEKDAVAYKQAYNLVLQEKWDKARSNMVRLGRDLARHGRPEYEAKIQAMEEGQETDVRLAALYALQDIGEPEPLNPILNLYDSTKSPQLRSRIVFMLQDFKAPEAFAKLRSIALTDPDPHARRIALIAMDLSLAKAS